MSGPIKASLSAVSQERDAYPCGPLQFVRGPISVATFPVKGRGVVADHRIEAGALIERCPVLVIPDHERLEIDKSIVFTYVFMWEQNTTEQDLYQHRGRAGIALGLTSLLNHSYSPNAEFVRHIDALTIDLIALRCIPAGEEITIDYQMTLWFTPQ